MAFHSRDSSRSVNPFSAIDRLDFDHHRKRSSNAGSEQSGPGGLLADNESLLSNVLDGVIERDRRKLRRNIVKGASFACALLCW